MKKIQVLLIEDNRLLRDGIEVLLKKQPDMKVVATVGNGENILEKVGALKPKILLLDLGLRSQNSLEIVKLIRIQYPDVKIIVMDLIPLQTDIYEYVQAGVSGFMLKDVSVTEFLKTIRSVNEGLQVLPTNLTGSLFSQIIDHALSKPGIKITESITMTKREKQVINLIADGYTNKEIAQALHLSTHTVKSHVHNILEKLSLSTRLQIAKHANFSEIYQNAKIDDSH